MGGFGQHLLFTLRNTIFNKLQELPVAFFAQNKAGDLISRINNDTDKVNQFFSQSLMQFVSSIFIIVGAGIALVCFNWRLGLAVLAPAALMWLFNKLVSPWVKKKNAISAKATGGHERRDPGVAEQFQGRTGLQPPGLFPASVSRQSTTDNYSTAISATVSPTMSSCLCMASCPAWVSWSCCLYGIYLIRSGILRRAS